MRPEMPFLAAGSITLAAGVKRDGAFPKDGLTAVVGTVGLVILASATTDSVLAPLVRALGFLVLLGAVMAAVKVFTDKENK